MKIRKITIYTLLIALTAVIAAWVFYYKPGNNDKKLNIDVISFHIGDSQNKDNTIKKILAGEKVEVFEKEIEEMLEDEDSYSDEKVIVVVKNTVSNDDIKQLAEEKGSSVAGVSLSNQITVGEGRAIELTIPEDSNIKKFMLDLYRMDDVIFAEPDYKRTLNDWTPNDPQLTNQWQLQNVSEGSSYGIEMPKAWEYVDTAMGGGGQQGGSSSVVVAILDTGLVTTSRPSDDQGWAFDPPTDGPINLWTNSGETPDDGIDNDGNNYIDDVNGVDIDKYYDYEYYSQPHTSEEGFPDDDFGHGTHVANIIAAATNNATLGSGISFNAQIMPIKVFDEWGRTWSSSIITGINYAINNNADVINMSFGGSQASQVESALLTQASNSGIVPVAATGNTYGTTVQYPAGYSSVIAVGASDQNGDRSSYSTYGSWIDLVAPVGPSATGIGQNNYDCYFDTTVYPNGDLDPGCIDDDGNPINGDGTTFTTAHYTFDYSAGTSFAAPQVAASAALIKSIPSLPQKPEEIRHLLRITTTLTDGTWKTTEKGYGILDAYNLLTSTYTVRIPIGRDSRGNTDVGDWSHGEWKAECNSNQALSGVSMCISSKQQYSALCKSHTSTIMGDPGSYSVYTYNPRDDRGSTISRDWDRGYWKGECADDEFVTGLSVTQPLVSNDSILCRQISDSYSLDRRYVKRTYYGGDSRGANDSRDWNYWYWKGECADNELLVGMSKSPTAYGAPHSILCRRYEINPTGHEILFYNGYDDRNNQETGDWNPGYWKAECDTNSFAKGLSMFIPQTYPNAMLCKDFGQSLVQNPQDFTTYTYFGGDDRGTDQTGDWDYGYWKGECAEDEYVAGVSMSPRYKYPHTILCQKFDTGKISITSNQSVYTYEGGDDRGDETTGDWDYYRWKGECASNEIMTGVSMSFRTYRPHSILCREYTEL